MNTIEESINEFDEVEKIVYKVPFTKNRNISSLNKSSRNKSQTYSSKNNINNKNKTRNNFYNFTLAYKGGNSNLFENKKDIKSITNTSIDSIKENSKYFISGNLLFEIFINLSEFDEDNLAFYMSYSNLCKLMKEVKLMNKVLYTDIIISQDDLDIILKKIKKVNSSSTKLNFKEFLKFITNLIYKIDYWHFIQNPKGTLRFNINKFFRNYFNDKMSFINLMYNYALYIQKEIYINELINKIIPYLKNIFIKFCEIKKEKKEEEKFTLDNDDINMKMNINKNKFNCIITAMKYLGIYPNLINLKELSILYFIQTDSNINNIDIDINIEELNSDTAISFKAFCQLFLSLCLYIKDKKKIIIEQYSYLLKQEKENYDLENELKYGQKEGIIRFILKLDINDYSNKIIQNNNNKKKSEEKFNSEVKKLSKKEFNFLIEIFEFYSSYCGKNLNYQISYSDVILFLKDTGFLNNKNNNQNFSLKEKYIKAKNKLNNNFENLKSSLRSLNEINKGKIYESKYIFNISYRNRHILSLTDIEIFYSKVSKSANNNNTLDFKEFIKLLILILEKIGFNSLHELMECLLFKKNNLSTYKKREIELNEIKKLYDKYKAKEEICFIIQQISPIINIYFISLVNERNKETITYDLFLKIFTEFELYPKLVNNNILRNIFYELYRINNDYKEKNDLNIILKNKEIGFDELLNSIGILTLYLRNKSNSDELQILFGIFHRIAESKKIKLDININFKFSEVLKDKLSKIYNIYFDDSNLYEPEYKLFLEKPFL